MTKLFDKSIDKMCLVCRHGTMALEDEVICARYGIVHPTSCCRKFEYDPISRIPPKPVPLNSAGFTKEDFTLKGGEEKDNE